jgi:hypothetical protein
VCECGIYMGVWIRCVSVSLICEVISYICECIYYVCVNNKSTNNPLSAKIHK